jgi:lysozyme family protein
MSTGGFGRCNVVTRQWEGGYANHPSDPGGKTMNGITEAVFHKWLRDNGLPLRQVRTITDTETDKIYKENYWDPANCERLFPGVDLSVYDASVNSGVSRGKKWLQQSIGSDDHTVTVKRICAKRSSFVHGLSTFKVFGKGWVRRITAIEATGVKWALESMKKPIPVVQETIRQEKEAAKKTANAQAGTAGGTVVPAGGAVVVPTAVPNAMSFFEQALIIGIGAAALVGVAYLGYRAWVNYNRAAAYGRV